jgi:hypothetical protein
MGDLMTILEAIALLILIVAIAVLVYYYLNDMRFVDKIKPHIPSNVSNIGSNIGFGGSEDGESIPVSEKLKTKIKDIDMPNISTDAFSNRLDTFLNEKSEELIKDWELATKNDINSLEDRFTTLNKDFSEFEKRFTEYKDYTNEKLDSFDERLEKLEKNENSNK